MSNLLLQEMESRDLFVVLHVWREKMLMRGDYRRPAGERFQPFAGSAASRL
jgi:hypothetical protein